jgi:ABC-type multidrug transport system fused ATPase/permease subunit
MRCTQSSQVHKTYINPKDVRAIDVSTLRRILAYVRPHWRSACVVVVCIALGAVLNLALPWFVKRIIDVAIPRGDVRLLWLYCAGMMAGPLAAGLIAVARRYTAERIGQRVMFDLRVALYGICTRCRSPRSRTSSLAKLSATC